MYDKIAIWFHGFCLFVVTGAGRERFLYLCQKNNIELKNIEPDGDSVSFIARKKDIKKLETYRIKSGVNIIVKAKKGFPYLMYRYRKRKCFVIGMVLAIASIYSFTLFVWDINVTGAAGYTAEQIKKDITDNYVNIGTYRKSIDCSELEALLREKYDRVAWVSCELKGTQLNVTLTETIEPDLVKKNDTPCNIVAAKDGIITDMITTSGTAVSENGAEVKKGDILITGVVNIYNEYDELIETVYLPADGYVYAVTEYQYSDSFPMEYYDKVYNGDNKKYYGIGFGSSIFMPFNIKDADMTDVLMVEHRLKLWGDYYLPLTFIEKTSSSYDAVLMEYTEEEALYKADKRLMLYIDNLRKKGVEILENNVTIDVADGSCMADGTIVVKELIGVPSDITIIEQGETQ